jgi:hypothetical protein
MSVLMCWSWVIKVSIRRCFVGTWLGYVEIVLWGFSSEVFCVYGETLWWQGLEGLIGDLSTFIGGHEVG